MSKAALIPSLSILFQGNLDPEDFTVTIHASMDILKDHFYTFWTATIYPVSSFHKPVFDSMILWVSWGVLSFSPWSEFHCCPKNRKEKKKIILVTAYFFYAHFKSSIKKVLQKK